MIIRLGRMPDVTGNVDYTPDIIFDRKRSNVVDQLDSDTIRLAIQNNYGEAGQVLTSGGLNGSISWQPAGGGNTPKIQRIAVRGNSAPLA